MNDYALDNVFLFGLNKARLIDMDKEPTGTKQQRGKLCCFLAFYSFEVGSLLKEVAYDQRESAGAP